MQTAAEYVVDEHGVGRLLDLGMIQPRLESLYSWSAAELSIPGLCDLLRDGVPAYAWDIAARCRGIRRRRDSYARPDASSHRDRPPSMIGWPTSEPRRSH